MSDVSKTRGLLDSMNAAANAAIERAAGPPKQMTTKTRSMLQQMNDAANAAIDSQVKRSSGTP
jgi:hypothetical protein